MQAYYVSAKTGDQVSSVFYQTAADLAGVQLPKARVEAEQKKVKAEIVRHGGDEAGAETGEKVTNPE